MLALVDGFLAPHFLLSELHEFSGPVLNGDHHAAQELRIRVKEVSRRIPAAARLVEELVDRPAVPCGCGCGPGQASETPARAPGTVSEAGLAELSLAVARAFACEPDDVLRAAIDSVVGLSFMATTLDRLLHVLDASGEAAVGREMDRLNRLLVVLPTTGPPMRSMSAVGLGIPGLPGGGLPGGGLPGGGLPGGGLPGGGLPGGLGRPPGSPLGDLRDALRERIKAKLEGPFRWNPEDWDHMPVGRFVPPFIDTRRITCQVGLALALRDRKESPPVRPARVVWSDSILRIDAEGPCEGNMVEVHGSGFGASQPADVVLMVPIAGWCTPLAVAAADWSDTRIRFALPPHVTSGPVGFADAAYVRAYDAWVDRMNKAASAAMEAAGCAGASLPDMPILRHFSECPPETPFNHLRAGSAIIRSFTVNASSLAVAEPGDGLLLAWEVVNAETSRIDRPSIHGPLLPGGYDQLLDPAPVSTLALGPATHNGPQRFTYVLTANGPCGTETRTVEVVATKRPGLSVSGLELTQGIQSIPPTVRYVALKPTVVRATVRHSLNGWGKNTVPGVVGRVRFQILGSPWSPWYDAVNTSQPIAPVPGGSITVQANPQRINTDDTLNFLIPPAFCMGDVIAHVEVRVTGFDARPDFPGFSESVGAGSPPVTFEPRRTLDLRYVRVNWGGTTPSDATCRATLLTAVPLLPTPMAFIQPLAGTGVVSGGASTSSRRDDLLDDFLDRHDCSSWEAATEFLGSDCPEDDGAIWVLIAGAFPAGSQGNSRHIPSDVCFTAPNDGPYAAHELSHCLNQIHLGVPCPNGKTAPHGDAPGAWPGGGLLADVPFDVTANTTVRGLGGKVWDVMTYCGTVISDGSDNTWPSPQRWQQLWDYIGA
ncbi:hypothetical protein ABTX82_34280 [Streptomyces lavendulae]|uniref:hypothetical protein n=1 Tax=Streptomyces lavendulae TaxID=1914 RepID=UPI00331C42BF